METADPIPQHIAIIPDGNRRWATNKKLAPWRGHEEGVERFHEVAMAGFQAGVKFVTFWAASYDNLHKRSRIEIEVLYRLLKNYLDNEKFRVYFQQHQIRVRVIGAWTEVVEDKDLVNSLNHLEQETSSFENAELTILFGYDGKREMLTAIKKLNGLQDPVTDENLRQNLSTGHLPDVDLVIRTGGEPHWSAGFLMWLTANSQFYFTQTLWPDFHTHELDMAIQDFQSRGRRFGK